MLEVRRVPLLPTRLQADGYLVLQWQEHNRDTPLYPGRRGCVRGKSSGSNRWEVVQSDLLRELPFGIGDGAEDSGEEQRQFQWALKQSMVAVEVYVVSPGSLRTSLTFMQRDPNTHDAGYSGSLANARLCIEYKHE